MNGTAAAEVAEVLDRVKSWSAPSRLALARSILESLEASGISESAPAALAPPPLRGVPVDAVAGRFRTDRPPLTDAECRQILEEERWRKYGS